MAYPLDPATCRPRYPAHARIIPTLYRSIESHGQITPALVRPVTPTADFPQLYEIICGHRRHATIRHLNHNGIETPFLADIRDLTEEEAFRFADIDNRDRADISNYQRAQTYAQALTVHYDGNQTIMARSLNFPTPTLNHYLCLAALPEPIVQAFHNPDALRLNDAIALTPRLRRPETAEPLLTEAKTLAAEQTARHSQGRPILSRNQVLRRLKKPKAAAPPAIVSHKIQNPGGPVIARGHLARNGSIAVTVPANPNIALDEQLAALRELLNIFMV
jgi:ParB family chromosome partitioning protein